MGMGSRVACSGLCLLVSVSLFKLNERHEEELARFTFNFISCENLHLKSVSGLLSCRACTLLRLKKLTFKCDNEMF